MDSLKDRIDAIGTPDRPDEDAIIPGTPFNERQARMLKNAVIIMGLMLIGGFALLIGIIAYRASQPAKTAPTIASAGVSVPHVSVPLANRKLSASGKVLPLIPKQIEGLIPKGTIYLNSTMDGNHLVLTLRTPDKNLKLVHIDLTSWRIVGEAALKQEN